MVRACTGFGCDSLDDARLEPAGEVVEDLLPAQLVERFVEHLGIEQESLVVRSQPVIEFPADAGLITGS